MNHEAIEIVDRFDVQHLLNRALHHDARKYVILQAASPDVMLAALQQDVSAGAMVPASIAVFELADGETAVVATEPFGALGSRMEWRLANPALAAIADRACEQVARALHRLRRAARRTHPRAA